MRVIVACEYSGTVSDKLAAKGHDVTTCDLLPTEGSCKHHQGDVRDILYDKWDMLICFPPCTHLCVSGARHFEAKKADGRQQEGIDFFMLFTALDHIPKTCIENPVGIMSSVYREPDQIVQPYYFGDPAQKTTCLWLKGLNPLVHIPPGDMFDEATHVDPGEPHVMPNGKKMSKWYWETSKVSGTERGHVRSKFWPGIASAIANQWG